MKASRELIRLLPDLDKLAERLREEPKEMVSIAFAADDPGMRVRSLTSTPAVALEGLGEPDPAAGILDEPWLGHGRRAVEKLQEDPEADLIPEEVDGLEAIVLLTGRPAILIHNGRFFHPPTEWLMLEDQRKEIESNCQSVGRIELKGHPSYEWVGTGFLVADDVIMTNRHVAEVFCQMGTDLKWDFRPGMSARIDYLEEVETAGAEEFALDEIIGVHDTLDMSLFRISQTSSTGATKPQPLSVASKFSQAEQGRQVYAVGYPAWDGYRNDPQHMMRIFSNVFNVKRLQPGEIMTPASGKIFKHDCSTLGGNSGSAVFDLETHRVVGLHFGGRYLQGNSAVALWKLTRDPLVKKAKINFV
jgi:V8-like Glu-specific endopeptidase